MLYLISISIGLVIGFYIKTPKCPNCDKSWNVHPRYWECISKDHKTYFAEPGEIE